MFYDMGMVVLQCAHGAHIEVVKPLRGKVCWEGTRSLRSSSSKAIKLSLVGSYSVLTGTSVASTSLISSLATYSLLNMTMALLPYCDSARKTLTILHCHDIFQLSHCELCRHTDYKLCSIKNYVRVTEPKPRR